MAKSLGKLFQRSLEHGSPESIEPAAKPRPPRPFISRVAATGSAIIGAGWAMLFLMVVAPGGASQATAAGVAIIAGGVILCAGWLGLFGTGHGGALAIVASAAPPLAVLYFRANMRDVFHRETTIAYVGLGFGLFAAGHLLALGLPRHIRVCAGIALAFVIVAFLAEAWHWDMPPGALSFLYLGAFGLLGTTSLLLSSRLWALARVKDH